MWYGYDMSIYSSDKYYCDNGQNTLISSIEVDIILNKVLYKQMRHEKINEKQEEERRKKATTTTTTSIMLKSQHENDSSIK